MVRNQLPAQTRILSFDTYCDTLCPPTSEPIILLLIIIDYPVQWSATLTLDVSRDRRQDSTHAKTCEPDIRIRTRSHPDVPIQTTEGIALTENRIRDLVVGSRAPQRGGCRIEYVNEGSLPQ